jgi:hypothetical protein
MDGMIVFVQCSLIREAMHHVMWHIAWAFRKMCVHQKYKSSCSCSESVVPASMPRIPPFCPNLLPAIKNQKSRLRGKSYTKRNTNNLCSYSNLLKGGHCAESGSPKCPCSAHGGFLILFYFWRYPRKIDCKSVSRQKLAWP